MGSAGVPSGQAGVAHPQRTNGHYAALDREGLDSHCLDKPAQQQAFAAHSSNADLN